MLACGCAQSCWHRARFQDELSGRLNGGRTGWNDDEPAVVEAACELATLRFFGTDYEGESITAFVADLRRRIPDERDRFDQVELEAVIRAALNDKSVATATLNLRTY